MPAYEYRAAVVRVIDGDTLKLDIDLGFSMWLRNISVRILGINTRELSDPGGQAAAAHLAGLLPAGAVVTARTVKPDKYGGRWLADVRMAGGQDLSAYLIVAGWAAPWSGVGLKPLPPWPRTLAAGD